MMLYDIFSYTGGRPAGRAAPPAPVEAAGACARSRRSRSDALVGGITYYDAQVDDARYVASLARTAVVLRRARREPRARSRGSSRWASGSSACKAHDLQTGEHFEIRAKQVVNATGVWTDDTQRMVGERGQFKVRASKGIHLVVPRDRIQSAMGMILRTEKSVLFVIPWGRHWLIGTTDTDWNLDKAHPAATAADIDYLLEHVNAVLAVPLTREDVEGVYAGLRPLLAGESDQTSKLSREHIVAHTVPGPRRGRRRQVDDLPDHGEGRDRRGRRRAGRQGAAVDDAGHPAARRRGVPGRVEQARQDRARVRRAQGAHRAPAQPLRHDRPTSCST